MADRRVNPGFWTLFSLGHSRALVRRPRFFLMATGIAVVYGLIAMIVGGMLTLFSPPAHLSSFWVLLPSGTPWWNYPGLLAVNPYFVLSLPFLPTLFMLVTSAGVGLGMSVAVLLSVGLIRRRRSSTARPAAVGTLAGLTPAMIALVTLGACCSTTAAATAGIGIAAQATGTTTGALLVNNWYLGIFQLAILYVALLAQEQLLTVYGALVRAPTPTDENPTPRPVDRRFVLGTALRVALLAGGVTWCLAMLADWFTANPVTASFGTWVGWILQHQLVGFAAILAALLPLSLLRALPRWTLYSPGGIVRILLVIAGLSLAVGMPPPLAAWGWHGFLNECLGVAGVSATWGGIAPGVPFGLELALRWIVQYVLLGGFALALGLRPELALRPICWTVAGTTTASAVRSVPPPATASTRPVATGRLSFPPGQDP